MTKLSLPARGRAALVRSAFVAVAALAGPGSALAAASGPFSAGIQRFTVFDAVFKALIPFLASIMLFIGIIGWWANQGNSRYLGGRAVMAAILLGLLNAIVLLTTTGA